MVVAIRSVLFLAFISCAIPNTVFAGNNLAKRLLLNAIASKDTASALEIIDEGGAHYHILGVPRFSPLKSVDFVDRKTQHTPLALALAQHQNEIAERLLQSGADPTLEVAFAGKMRSPLSIAAVSNSVGLKLLADCPNADLKWRNQDGCNLLHFARSAETMTLLLEMGVNAGEKCLGDVPIVRLLTGSWKDLDDQKTFQEIVERLINFMKVSPLLKLNLQGDSLLHVLARTPNEDLGLAIFRLMPAIYEAHQNKPGFVDYRDFCNSVTNDSEMTVLSTAASLGKSKIVHHLLKDIGVSPNGRTDNNGNTALLKVLQNYSWSPNRLDIVSLLLFFGADPDVINLHGVTSESYFRKESTLRAFAKTLNVVQSAHTQTDIKKAITLVKKMPAAGPHSDGASEQLKGWMIKELQPRLEAARYREAIDDRCANDSLNQRCKICFDEDKVKGGHQRGPANCGCYVCDNCSPTFIKTSLEKLKDSEARCPGCKLLMRPEYLDKRGYAPEFVKHFMRAWTSHLEPGRLECPSPDCPGGQMPRAQGGGQIGDCDYCDFSGCFRCKTKQGCLCEPGSQVRMNPDADLQHFLEEQASTGTMQRCPKCKFAAQKDENCNHVACIACGHHWSWNH